MTQQRDIERRMPRRFGGERSRRERCRWRASDAPPSLRRTRHRRGIDAQNQREHAALRRCHGETARGGEIEPGHRAVQFEQDRPQLPAAHPVQPRAQHAERIGSDDHDQPRRIAAKIDETGGVEKAVAARRAVIPHPQQALRGTKRAQGEQQRESGGGAAVAVGIGKNLMQRRAGEAAVEACIGAGGAEGDGVGAVFVGRKRPVALRRSCPPTSFESRPRVNRSSGRNSTG